jgi:hypothetical protein
MPGTLTPLGQLDGSGVMEYALDNGAMGIPLAAAAIVNLQQACVDVATARGVARSPPPPTLPAPAMSPEERARSIIAIHAATPGADAGLRCALRSAHCAAHAHATPSASPSACVPAHEALRTPARC